ncbi:MAG: hypothetical protein LLG08_07125 [Actinomycetia bacterium]|nr:hypothetical protein [Actinomycetes bacterium]
MSSAQRQTIVDIPQPAYKLVADQIINIATELKAGGNDQDTIRAALHVFGQALSAGGAGTEALVEAPRRY